MASSTRGGGRGDVKSFFRQRKTSSGIAKPKGKKSSPINSAAFGSDVAQPAALISHASPDLTDNYDGNEEMLRQFDMNMVYGPCLGMTRLARWERASNLGLNPPTDVERLLREAKVHSDCLWDGRV